MRPPEDTNPNILDEDLPTHYRAPTEHTPGARRVDRAAPELARLCAGWAHRGRSLEDLVGYVTCCECHPKVMPRDELGARLAPGPLLDALRAIRSDRGRLAVVAATSAGWDGERAYHDHHVLIPRLDVPRSRGCLEPLSAERRALLDRRIEMDRSRLLAPLAKDLFDHRTPDALYLGTFMLEHGGGLTLAQKCFASAEDRPSLEAADFEVQPGKMLCIVRREWVWQENALAWIDLAELGLSLETDPCFERTRLYDLFLPPIRLNEPCGSTQQCAPMADRGT